MSDKDDNLKEETHEEKKEVKKEKSKDKNNNLFQKIMSFILCLMLISWLVICGIDFVKTQRVEKPIFCVKEDVKKYDDGSVYCCTGLGYKIYHYNRTSLSGVEYGPFWSKDRSKQ